MCGRSLLSLSCSLGPELHLVKSDFNFVFNGQLLFFLKKKKRYLILKKKYLKHIGKICVYIFMSNKLYDRNKLKLL